MEKNEIIQPEVKELSLVEFMRRSPLSGCEDITFDRENSPLCSCNVPEQGPECCAAHPAHPK